VDVRDGRRRDRLSSAVAFLRDPLSAVESARSGDAADGRASRGGGARALLMFGQSGLLSRHLRDRPHGSAGRFSAVGVCDRAGVSLVFAFAWKELPYDAHRHGGPAHRHARARGRPHARRHGPPGILADHLASAVLETRSAAIAALAFLIGH
jgi:hypothetical protein